MKDVNKEHALLLDPRDLICHSRESGNPVLRRIITSARAFVGLGLSISMALLAACGSMNPFSKPDTPPAPLTKLGTSFNLSTSRGEQSFELQTLWRFRTGNTQLGKLPGYFQPAVVKTTVYAANADGKVFALDLATGQTRWQISLKTALVGGVAANETWVVVASPTEVIALDATGNIRWRILHRLALTAAPQLIDGAILLRTADHRMVSLDLESGSRRWVFTRPAPALTLRQPGGVVETSGGLITGFVGGKLLNLSPQTGAPRWEATVAQPKGATEIERIADITGLPVVVGAEVCAVAFQGRLGCFDLGRGTASWTRPFSGSNGLAADASMLVLPDERSELYAFTSQGGSSLWKNDQLLRRQLSTPALLPQTVVVGDLEGYLHWLSRDDGRLLARLRPDSSPLAGPMLVLTAPHGGVLVQTRDGLLTAIVVKPKGN